MYYRDPDEIRIPNAYQGVALCDGGMNIEDGESTDAMETGSTDSPAVNRNPWEEVPRAAEATESVNRNPWEDAPRTEEPTEKVKGNPWEETPKAERASEPTAAMPSVGNLLGAFKNFLSPGRIAGGDLSSLFGSLLSGKRRKSGGSENREEENLMLLLVAAILFFSPRGDKKAALLLLLVYALA